MNMMLCRCGPSASTRRVFATDAGTRSRGTDPTGTLPLQRRFQKDLRARWDRLRKLIPAAVDQVLSPVARAGGDPIRAFQTWLDAALQSVVLGQHTGAWTLLYVRQAGDCARLRSQLLLERSDLGATADRIPQLQILAIAELQGICEATSQQSVRAFGNGLLTRQTPAAIARSVQSVIDSVGKQRSDLLVSFFVVRAFSAVTLDCFRAAGLLTVGVVAERVGLRLSPPSQRRLTRDAARKTSTKNLVEVLTAGDDDVCPTCEEISESGPYTLDEAEKLIPAHPCCRCGFVPWGDARFASVHDAFNPNEPRDTGGKWTSGGVIPPDDWGWAGDDPDNNDPPSESLKAVTSYQSHGYNQINQQLREGKLNEKTKKTVRALDSLIASSKMKKTMTVWRGVSPNKKLNTKMFVKAIGKTITLKGYTSTSARKDVASDFGSELRFRIEVPKDVNALEIKSEEKELLLPRNAKFRVENVQISKDSTWGGMHEVYLRMVK